MKKVFQKVVSVLLVFALINMQGFAGVNVFSLSDNGVSESEFAAFNEDAFYDEFAEISELETLLLNNDMSYSELEQEGSVLLANVSPDPMMPFSDDGGAEGTALGIPSFLWGCVLGWVGLLIVYLMTESQAETKKALWGCIASAAVGVIVYVIVIAAAASASTTSSGYNY